MPTSPPASGCRRPRSTNVSASWSRAGVIRSYRAVVDPEALGLFVTALIAATPLDPQQPDDLPERVAEFPEVEDCLSVAGEASYILKVRTKTTGDLEDLIRRLREKAGVATRNDHRAFDPLRGPAAPHVARRNTLEGSISRRTPA